LHNLNHHFKNLPALYDFPDLWNTTRLVVFIFGYRITDFVQYFQSLLNIYRPYVPYKVWRPMHNINLPFRKSTGVMDFTRSGELCAILISLSIIYRAYELYKVLLPLHNINHCFINLPGLWTLQGLVTLVQYLRAFWTFTGLMYLIRSCNLCIISSTIFINLPGLCTSTTSGDLWTISTSLSNIYPTYVSYKVLRPLHNI
jgi:hypothetical protein